MGLREIHPQDVSRALTGILNALGRYREYKVGCVRSQTRERASDAAEWIKVSCAESGLNLASARFLHSPRKDRARID